MDWLTTVTGDLRRRRYHDLWGVNWPTEAQTVSAARIIEIRLETNPAAPVPPEIVDRMFEGVVFPFVAAGKIQEAEAFAFAIKGQLNHDASLQDKLDAIGDVAPAFRSAFQQMIKGNFSGAFRTVSAAVDRKQAKDSAEAKQEFIDRVRENMPIMPTTSPPTRNWIARLMMFAFPRG